MADVRLEPREAARRAAEELSAAQQISVGHQEVPLTEELRDGLRALLQHVAAGEGVAVTPLPELLSTQQVADILRVSRPTVVKMLDDGVIHHTRPGVHRRVPRQALEDFIASLPERRAAGLDELASTFDPETPDRIVTTR